MFRFQNNVSVFCSASFLFFYFLYFFIGLFVEFSFCEIEIAKNQM